jgi:hypothetical protein
MRLNKSWAATAILVLGVIAASAIVSAQSAGGSHKQIAPAPTIHRPLQAVTDGDNLIVDWIPTDGKSEKREIVVDPTRHCIHISMMSLKRDDRLNNYAVRVDLKRCKM